MLPYQRILIKISGEALGDSSLGISSTVLSYIVDEIIKVLRLNITVAVVVGGGNIIRGKELSNAVGINRVNADYMGMLATVINGMMLQAVFNNRDIETRLQTALSLEQFAQPYIRDKAISHLNKKRVVIFGGGTGNPFFTTDTAAALRAAEIGADAIFKATKVDGVYEADPMRDDQAKKFDTLSFDQAIQQKLGVMDATALTLCQERKIPIHIFNLHQQDALVDIINGKSVGTTVTH